MRDRFFTWSRLIFLVVFAYINYTISMRFAYHRYFLFKPIDFLQLLVSVFIAVGFLFLGQGLGELLHQHELGVRKTPKDREKIVDLIGFLVAIILGLVFNLFNVLIHIDTIAFLEYYSS